MQKNEAIELHGKRQIDLARALGRCKGAISAWPPILDDDRINLVLGAAVRRGIKIPEKFIDRVGE